MGSSHSHVEPQADSEQVYAKVTRRIAQNFTQAELLELKQVFDSLATPLVEYYYLTEDTFTKFLEIPDQVSSLLYASAGYIASFPYTSKSPVPLTFDALLRVVGFMTRRVHGVMPDDARLRLLYDSIAILKSQKGYEKSPDKSSAEPLVVLNSDHTFEFPKTVAPESPTMSKEDLKGLLQFLLSIQEMDDIEVVANYIHRFSEQNKQEMKAVSACLVNTISKDDMVTFQQLRHFVDMSPSLLNSLSPLFSHFFHPTRPATSPSGPLSGSSAAQKPPRPSQSLPADAVLNENTIAQISLFIPRDLIFGKLDILYRGAHDGFSMGSFETKTLRYPGPTLTLLHGKSSNDQVVRTLGFFSVAPWKQSSKHCFGDHKSILFQIAPLHYVRSGFTSANNLWFHKTLGIGIGSAPPLPDRKPIVTAPASLYMDTSLEIAHFTFDEANIYEDITIDDIEVYGCGGSDSLTKQREAWAWQEEEAARRQNVNIKDHQGDWDLLELAGLVGQHRSGGSI